MHFLFSRIVQELGKMFAFILLIFFNLFQIQAALDLKKDDFTDYCEWFGEDDIQGKFLKDFSRNIRNNIKIIIKIPIKIKLL